MTNTEGGVVLQNLFLLFNKIFDSYGFVTYLIDLKSMNYGKKFIV